MNKLIEDYEQLSQMQLTQIKVIRENTNKLWNEMNNSLVSVSPRELALAKTNLQQAAMWYTHGVVNG